MPKDLLSASAALYYLFFKTVIAALNELLFITNHIEFYYFTMSLSLMYKSVGKAKEIFPKKIAEILHSPSLFANIFVRIHVLFVYM
jgi:hypothetical protein